MFSISNVELEKCPPIKETISCPHCNDIHIIKYGETILKDGSKRKSDLAYYKCRKTLYLAGIAGKSII